MKYEETKSLFAAHAMAAIMVKTPYSSEEGVAKDAWKQADAMMDEYRRLEFAKERGFE